MISSSSQKFVTALIETISQTLVHSVALIRKFITIDSRVSSVKIRAFVIRPKNVENLVRKRTGCPTV